MFVQSVQRRIVRIPSGNGESVNQEFAAGVDARDDMKGVFTIVREVRPIVPEQVTAQSRFKGSDVAKIGILGTNSGIPTPKHQLAQIAVPAEVAGVSASMIATLTKG
jgi:hypothetical protein